MSKKRLRRPHMIKIRLFDGELQRIRYLADAAGMDMSEFLRESATKTQVVNREDWRQRTYLLIVVVNYLSILAHWAKSTPANAETFAITVCLLRLERLIRSAFGLTTEPPG